MEEKKNKGDAPYPDKVELTMTHGQFALDNKMVNEESVELAKEQLLDCYEHIKKIIKRYMDMPEDSIKITALWIVGTYMYKEFETYPFLFVNAMRGSGKTRLLKIIANLSWNGKFTNSPTEAVLFRSASKSTIVIDEFENPASKDKSALKEILHTAYKKGSIVERIKRVNTKEGEERVIEGFEVYTPFVMANISGMDDVLNDRCISFILEKSSSPHKTKLIENFSENEILIGIKRTLNKIKCSLCSVCGSQEGIERWNSYIDKVYNYTYTLPTLTTLNTLPTQLQHKSDEKSVVSNEHNVDEKIEREMFDKILATDINGRNLELYYPLFIISNLIGKGEFDDILRIATELVSEKTKDEYADSLDVALLDFVANQIDPLQYYWISELTQEFKTFSNMGVMDDVNPKWMGHALKRLKLDLNKVRGAKGMKTMLDVAKAQDKVKKYKTQEVKE